MNVLIISGIQGESKKNYIIYIYIYSYLNAYLQILSDCSADDRISHIHELLERLSEDLKAGKIPLSSLSITKQLTKEPDDYPDKKSLPHVQV